MSPSSPYMDQCDGLGMAWPFAMYTGHVKYWLGENCQIACYSQNLPIFFPSNLTHYMVKYSIKNVYVNTTQL